MYMSFSSLACQGNYLIIFSFWAMTSSHAIIFFIIIWWMSIYTQRERDHWVWKVRSEYWSHVLYGSDGFGGSDYEALKAWKEQSSVPFVHRKGSFFLSWAITGIQGYVTAHSHRWPFKSVGLSLVFTHQPIPTIKLHLQFHIFLNSFFLNNH